MSSPNLEEGLPFSPSTDSRHGPSRSAPQSRRVPPKPTIEARQATSQQYAYWFIHSNRERYVLYRLTDDIRAWTRLYGPLGSLTVATFGMKSVWKMEAEVLADPADPPALEFKRIVQDESRRIAISGTVITQVAITALSLPNLSQTHWVARASWIFSLVSALLAVYYANQQDWKMGRLLLGSQIRAWIRNVDTNTNYIPADLRAEGYRTNNNFVLRSLTPAPSSVLIVSAPGLLLSAALHFLLIGLGIYIGFVWTSGLDTSAGSNDSRNVFIVYLVSLSFSYGVYSLSGIFQDNWSSPSVRRIMERSLTRIRQQENQQVREKQRTEALQQEQPLMPKSEQSSRNWVEEKQGRRREEILQQERERELQREQHELWTRAWVLELELLEELAKLRSSPEWGFKRCFPHREPQLRWELQKLRDRALERKWELQHALRTHQEQEQDREHEHEPQHQKELCVSEMPELEREQDQRLPWELPELWKRERQLQREQQGIWARAWVLERELRIKLRELQNMPEEFQQGWNWTQEEEELVWGLQNLREQTWERKRELQQELRLQLERQKRRERDKELDGATEPESEVARCVSYE